MIYLDHSATAPLSRPVLEAMWPFLTEAFGNPSSTHEIGRLAAAGMDAARDDVASVLNARPGEVTFTSGGTEANNLAIQGIALARPRGRHIVTTSIEHKAVLATCEHLERQFGFEVTVVPVDRDGLVNVDDIAGALRDDTTLCSVMYANNDVGTVQPIEHIAPLCKAKGIPFHTDAVQAAGLLSLNVDDLGVDAVTISAHKFGGPKGAGALYVRTGIPLTPLIHGGGQERGARSGTQNVAGAVGLAVALKLADDARLEAAPRLSELRDKLIEGTLTAVPEAVLTGHPTLRLPHHASFCFHDVAGEAVLQELEMNGVSCSSGSACAAGSDEASHVLLAMGIPLELARTAVRFTLGPTTSAEDIDEVVRLVPRAVGAVRSLSRR